MKVVPGAATTAIAGWLGDALKVRVAAPPQRGKANVAVEALIAEALGLPAAAVRIVAGHGSARKLVEVDGMTITELQRRLGDWQRD